MLEILYRIFIGHTHKWKIIKEKECVDDYGGRWNRYYGQCEICGKVKTFDRSNKTMQT